MCASMPRCCQLSLGIVVEADHAKIVERSMSLEGVQPDVWSVLVSARRESCCLWVEISSGGAPTAQRCRRS